MATTSTKDTQTELPPVPSRQPTMPPVPTEASESKVAVPTLKMPVKGKSAPRCLLIADNGWGKTTTALNVAKPEETALLMAQGETNYYKLVDVNLVPEVPCVELKTWHELTGLLESWIDDPKLPYKVIVLDTLYAFQRLIQTYICHLTYNDDWSSTGFLSFNKGPRDCLQPWLGMLNQLGILNDRGITIMILEQMETKEIANAQGDDYLKIIPRTDKWVANVTKDWADLVIFGTWKTITDNKNSEGKKGKMKGIGGSQRVAYTSNHDAYTAKNQHGLPPVIEIAEDRTSAWSTIMALKGTH